MKLVELRLNNYVMCRGALSKVSSINEDSIGYKKRNGIGEDKIPLHLVSQIPLTEEWLLKLGFIRHHYDYANDVIYIKNIADNEIDNAEFEWGVYPNELGSGIQIKNRKSLKYIHQIQNLYFALTGEELSLQKL
jgi:hypothetical protein